MSRDQNAGCGIVAALLLLVLFGLFVLGLGGVFFMRTAAVESVQVSQRLAFEAEEAAMRAREEVRLQQELATSATTAEAEPAAAVTTLIGLAADGTLQRDGVASDWDQLRAHLRGAPGAEFVVEVAPQCSFEKLSELLKVFEEAGVAQPRLRTDAAP